MAGARTDLLQGTLDLLILKALALEKMHGMGISRRIAQITNGTFEVKPGSLFPALHRMEEAGWLSSSWGEAETNRRAKFYRLTKLGRRQLDAETEQWERISLAMASEIRSHCSVSASSWRRPNFVRSEERRVGKEGRSR